jgi:hypothetical protein
MVSKTQTVMIPQLEVISIQCNACAVEEEAERFEGLTVHRFFGYHSKLFGDMTEIEFHLCEKCLCNFTETFKIPPEVKEHI